MEPLRAVARYCAQDAVTRAFGVPTTARWAVGDVACRPCARVISLFHELDATEGGRRAYRALCNVLPSVNIEHLGPLMNP